MLIDRYNQAIRQLAAVTRERDALRQAFDQLDPQRQAESMDYVKILAVVMHEHGITDFECDLARVIPKMPPSDVVFGDPVVKNNLRVRLLRRPHAGAKTPS